MKVRLLRVLDGLLVAAALLVMLTAPLAQAVMFGLGFLVACTLWWLEDRRRTAEVRALVKEFETRRTSPPRVLRP
jgi:uncharacterized protein (DUF2062 family)